VTRRLAAALLFVLWVQQVAAVQTETVQPTLTARLDTTRITLGDPLHLRLTVGRDAGQRTLFPDLDEQLAPFAVRSMSAAKTTDLGANRRRDERVYELRAYQLEVESVPAVEVLVVTVDGDTLRLQSQPQRVELERVREPEEADELRGIKPPLHIPGGLPLWLVGILGAALAIGIALLAGRILRRKPSALEPGVVIPRGRVDYVREFARIAAMGLLERDAIKLYYTRLADVMWRFLEETADIEALDRTTGEIALDLQLSDRVDATTARQIKDFLETADLVKFARLEPPRQEAQAVPDAGARIVTQVAQLRGQREAALVTVSNDNEGQ
jgi:hypothetical protein